MPKIFSKSIRSAVMTIINKKIEEAQTKYEQAVVQIDKRVQGEIKMMQEIGELDKTTKFNDLVESVIPENYKTNK